MRNTIAKLANWHQPLILTSMLLLAISQFFWVFTSLQARATVDFSEIGPQIGVGLFAFVLTAVVFWAIHSLLTEQQQVYQQKNDFVHNTVHDLKTPITTLEFVMDALADATVLSDPEQAQSYVEISKTELERLGFIVNQVLRSAQMERDDLQLSLDMVDLGQITHAALRGLKFQFDHAQAKTAFEPPPDGTAMVMGDRQHLLNIVSNLLENALKYSPNNPEINILVEKIPSKIRLTVEDNGLGIPAEYQAKIFDRFFRVPTADRASIQGHGLGLNYVATIVRLHGGTIQVESKEGKGSSFCIELPSAG